MSSANEKHGQINERLKDPLHQQKGCCGHKHACSEKPDKQHEKNHHKHQSTSHQEHGSCQSEQQEVLHQKKEQVREPKTLQISDIELEALKAELSDCKDKYLRVLAESENARKRLQKEKQEMIQYALQNVVIDFLNPIDHMENALKFTEQMSAEVKHWALGFQMILTQFKDVLTANGVIPFTSEGKSFDPHLHEAIEMIATSDFPAGIVIEESLKGYLMGERTIRPARVKVSKTPPE